jgi:hypothetical protein
MRFRTEDCRGLAEKGSDLPFLTLQPSMGKFRIRKGQDGSLTLQIN